MNEQAAATAAEIAALRRRIAELEAALPGISAPRFTTRESAPAPATAEVTCGLPPRDIRRYGRQMIVPAFGAPSQLALRRCSMLIVGAGGLGCPAALYLAAAGVCTLGIVDDDVVEESNLHRQVGHSETRMGAAKAASLAAAARALNSGVEVSAYATRLTPTNAFELMLPYDVIVDACDNPGTRYLLSDACVLLGKPLVSGAAVGCDGQLTVYNLRSSSTGSSRSLCYRCLHPEPPGAVASCADAGVLGPVTGVIGSLMALEAMKVACRVAATTVLRQGDAGAGSGGAATPFGDSLAGRLLVYDGADARFRVLKLRDPRPDCAVCGTAPTIRSLDDTARWLHDRGVATEEVSPTDDSKSAASCPCDRPKAESDETVPEISVAELAARRQQAGDGGDDVRILDCRDAAQFGICSLRGSVNIPLIELRLAGVEKAAHCVSPDADVFVVCRRGVDSIEATQILRRAGLRAFNVQGGLRAFSDAVDKGFPTY